ncbi:ABC transporter permease [Amycolatopsis kentuckyensis]|uniref:ABC transporter permease n=1 Tax=Amycolatopsis kentuckyensis TaxID=218823 RepID=UPI000A390C0A|nr:ABC transporter permease [Amycolatopsis kentuckyensis]
MIWVTWRQQRVPILATALLVVVAAVVLAFVRADVVSLLPDRTAVSAKYGDFLQYYVFVMLVVPVLLGMFTGAPLFAREIEQGTHVFGLSQSISRARWVATKLAVAGGALALSMFSLGLVAAWALAPAGFVLSGRLNETNFETQGVVVGGYAFVAFVVGAVAGLFLRNTLAAMVVTLAVYVALVFTVANGVRPHYAEPTVVTAPIGGHVAIDPEAWVTEYGYQDANGNDLPYSYLDCARQEGDQAACLREKGIATEYSAVHLPSQFWRFQFTELAVLLVLAAAVLATGAQAARRRLT